MRTLINIAQVYIKKLVYDDALEYISRVLYLDANHVKALSRKAFILTEQKQYREALVAGLTALKVDPTNKDILLQVDDIKAILKSSQESERAKELSQMYFKKIYI